MKREKLGAPKTIDFWFDSTSLVAPTVKRLPTMWETRLQSLGWEDPLQKEMATHSSTRAWRIPWTEEPSRLQTMELQSQTRLSNFDFTSNHIYFRAQLRKS